MRSLVCLALAMAATSSAAVEVYRSIAPDGTVVYSDRPTSGDAVPVFVATRRADGTGSLRPAPSQPARPPATAPELPAAAVPAESTRAEIAEQRAQNCATARDRVERYNMSHRLYRSLPNGEREYLDAAEIDEARAQAAADVENWCN